MTATDLEASVKCILIEAFYWLAIGVLFPPILFSAAFLGELIVF
ncbi:MAG: hypothetical protein Q8P67_27525 [archaeon]|nr:hypothetical protein [archaeon]